jgi:hypothetical protein
MNALNFQASVSQLTQMDRFQHDSHRTPVVNQDQNAQIAGDEAKKRVATAVQPDEIEKKKIDPRQRREENARQRRSKKQPLNAISQAKEIEHGTSLDIRI